MKAVHRYICRKFNIEYISIPKAACSTIKEAILRTDNQDIPDDADELLALDNIHHHPWWFRPVTVEPHFRFTFVRNPFDRLVSCYTGIVQTGWSSRAMGVPLPKHWTFAKFASWAMTQWIANQHYAPQSSILNDIFVDFCGTVENIRTDWATLQDRFSGLHDLGHANASATRPSDWHDLYDAETLAMATDYFASDLDRWPFYAEPSLTQNIQ